MRPIQWNTNAPTQDLSTNLETIVDGSHERKNVWLVKKKEKGFTGQGHAETNLNQPSVARQGKSPVWAFRMVTWRSRYRFASESEIRGSVI
jgi:hypothetical protein